MEINDADDLTGLIEIQLSSLSTLITADGYELVCDQTMQELGWSYPLTTSAKLFWAMKRGTRHAMYILLIASANKFKYKLVNLQHRFEHFQKLIADMDKEFATAMASEPSLFCTVGSADPNAFRMFGTKIDAGFSYDSIGNDTTYNTDKYVNFAPLEDD
jgi:hypothetical protein